MSSNLMAITFNTSDIREATGSSRTAVMGYVDNDGYLIFMSPTTRHSAVYG